MAATYLQTRRPAPTIRRRVVSFDLREPDAELDTAAEILESGYSEQLYRVVFATLPCGDITWYYPDGRGVVVERKTPADLRNSFRLRLRKQISNMRQTGLFPVLFLDGFPYRSEKYGFWVAPGDPSEETMRNARWGVPFQSVANFLLSVQMSGVAVYAWPAGHVADAVHYLYQYFAKAEHTSIENYTEEGFTTSPQSNLLLAVDGVGLKLATTLLNQYRTPMRVAEAALQGELRRDAHGVGPKLEQAIVTAFYGRGIEPAKAVKRTRKSVKMEDIDD